MAHIELAPDDLIVPLREADAVDGLKLSIDAGWNQTLDDWQTLLRLGRGFGVRTLGRRDAFGVPEMVAAIAGPEFG
jgi:hypothetical protein